MKRHFYAIPPPPYGQNTFFGREMERRQKRGKKYKGKMDDRRQKVEEGETSKRRSFSGSWEEMRKKVSLHQTQELPLLQTVPAQRLDETRYLTLNWSPTALLGESGGVCVCVCLHVFMQLGAWRVILYTKVTAATCWMNHIFCYDPNLFYQYQGAAGFTDVVFKMFVRPAYICENLGWFGLNVQ